MSLQPSTAQRAITPAASPHSTSILDQHGSKQNWRNKTRLTPSYQQRVRRSHLLITSARPASLQGGGVSQNVSCQGESGKNNVTLQG